jgi:hypothetical protein
MLFDLRGRGRRRTVRVIYIGLAVLIGVGLVGFGVGGGFGGGGIATSLSGHGSGARASYSSQISNYRKQLKRNPNDAATWEKLTKVLALQAGGEGFRTSSGALTKSGEKAYEEVGEAWNHYTALTHNPNIGLAKIMVRIFDEEGLSEPTPTVEVLQTIVAAEPHNASYYGFLAEYSYLAHKNALGDLATRKAVALAPVGQRTHLKIQLEELKKKANEKQGPTGSTGTTGATATTGTTSTGGTTSLTAP